MKKKLRVSGYNDYVAVDEVGEKGKILSTPIYLTKDKPSFFLAFDAEENRYYKTEVTFDGKKLLCHSLKDDFKWESPLDELTDGTFKPFQ